MQNSRNAGPAQILLTDDSSAARTIIRNFLETDDHIVIEAKNGLEAVKRFRETMPEMVIMDANMPVVDGFKACTEIRKHPKGSHVPIIMVTGQGDDASVEKAFASGAQEYVTKPIHWAVLRQRIRLSLESFRTRKATQEAFARLTVILDNAADAIIVINHKGIIESFNHAAEKTFGYSIQEAIGMNVSRLMPSPYRERHDQYLKARQKTDEARILGKKIEVVGERKNGTIFPIELVVSEVKLEDQTLFTGIVRDITARKRAEEKIFRQAHYDALTDLPNRALFMEHLEYSTRIARKEAHALALIFVDLDRFKWVNDTLGHTAGDKLLQTSAKRLQNSIKEGDRVARLGGDEFTIILEKIKSEEEVAAVAKRILRALNSPFVYEGKTFFISGSLGIALFPKDADTMEDLLKHADEAMYRSKDAGKNAYHFFSGASLVLEKRYTPEKR